MSNNTLGLLSVLLFVILSAKSTRSFDILKSLDVYLIDPGTKWCGPGNIAKDDDDLGEYSELDACCRAHDMCPDSIERGSAKHGLNNTGLFTRSHCNCDAEFHACLKAVNSTAKENAEVTKVGFVYFNVLASVCFKLAPPARCEKTRRHMVPFMSYYFPKEGHFTFVKCAEYRNVASDILAWQWFENPVY